MAGNGGRYNENVSRALLLFTKPAQPGRVKTRLIGDLSAEQAAQLHAAFLADALERLAGGDFELGIAWALEDGEALPSGPGPGLRQNGATLGERLYDVLRRQAESHAGVAAAGSDHPSLARALVEEAFTRLEAAADVVLGPAEDGGYYLIALRAAAVRAELFSGIPWSTAEVLAATLDRCRRLGLRTELLPPGADVDTPADLRRLAARLAADASGSPRTHALLAAWGRLAP